MNVKKNVLSFAIAGFILLAVLFGMQIMTFIFGILGPDASGLTAGTEAYNISANVQNNSLGAINTYAAGSNTQFNTVSIAITLALLIAVFFLFWGVIGYIMKQSKGGGGGNFS